MDDLFESKSKDLCLKAVERRGHKEIFTMSELMRFTGRKQQLAFDKVKVLDDTFYTERYYHGKSIPRDAKIRIYVYGAHKNTEQTPCNICIGCALFNLYDLWLIQKNKSKGTIQANLTNRNYKYGTITLTFDSGWHQFNMGPYTWSKKDVFKNLELQNIATRHANEEYSWLKKFERYLAGTADMIDVFGFTIFGNTLPTGFFARRHADYCEKYYLIVLFCVLRRNAYELNISLESIYKNFNKLPFQTKCGILADMAALQATSATYITDYIITNGLNENSPGRRILKETFHANLKGDSGDCEDFAAMINNWFETFQGYKDFKNPVLQELRLISKFYIANVPLWRTTVPQVNLQPQQIRQRMNNYRKKKFSSIQAQRIADCDGDNSGISAHMNVACHSKEIFIRNMEIPEGFDSRFKRVLEIEKEKFEKNVAQYQEQYDANFKRSDIQNFIIEGTGVFDPVNRDDPHLDYRTLLRNRINLFRFCKFRIYHPVGDPKQFFLNMLLLVSTYFLKKYGVPVTSFVLSYTDQKPGKHVYGITHRDFVEDNPYVICPYRPLNRKEEAVMCVTSRWNNRQQYTRFKPDVNLERYEDVEKILPNIREVEKKQYQLDSPFDVDSMSEVYDGTNDQDKVKEFARALSKAKIVCDQINKNLIAKRPQDPAKSKEFLFICKTVHMNQLGVMTQFKRDIIQCGLPVCHVDYFYEMIGESTKNIIFKVSIKSNDNHLIHSNIGNSSNKCERNKTYVERAIQKYGETWEGLQKVAKIVEGKLEGLSIDKDLSLTGVLQKKIYPHILRVLIEDGIHYGGTLDWRPTRANVEVRDGIIIRVIKMG